MEKLLGPFPSSMIDASPVRRDLFRRDNTLRIEELSQDSYRELQNMPSSLRVRASVVMECCAFNWFRCRMYSMFKKKTLTVGSSSS